MARILILGGAGFVGYHLARRLGEEPLNRITLVDDLSRGRADAELAALLARPSVELVKADLTDPGAVNPPQTLDLGQLATSGSTTLAVPPGTWQASLRATNSAAQTTTVQLGTIVQPG